MAETQPVRSPGGLGPTLSRFNPQPPDRDALSTAPAIKVCPPFFRLPFPGRQELGDTEGSVLQASFYGYGQWLSPL